MLLAADKEHKVHYVAKYFEIHRAKKAELYLIKPDKFSTKISSHEKHMVAMKFSKKTSRFEANEKRTLE